MNLAKKAALGAYALGTLVSTGNYMGHGVWPLPALAASLVVVPLTAASLGIDAIAALLRTRGPKS